MLEWSALINHLPNNMARDEVRSLLAGNGLTVAQAQQRVDALANNETQQHVEKFSE